MILNLHHWDFISFYLDVTSNSRSQTTFIPPRKPSFPFIYFWVRHTTMSYLTDICFGDCMESYAAIQSTSNMTTDQKYLTKCPHFLQDSIDIGHDILAIHHDRFIRSIPESNMKNGSIFRKVDLLSAKHCISGSLHSSRLCLGILENDNWNFLWIIA